MRRKGFARTFVDKKARKRQQRLSPEDRRAADEALMQLVDPELAVGLEYKPIKPSGKLYEARINRAWRLVIQEIDDVAHVIDICTHDELPKYGR